MDPVGWRPGWCWRPGGTQLDREGQISRPKTSKPKPKPASNESATKTPARRGAALLRQIPSVEEVLNRASIRKLAESAGRKFVTERVREVLAAFRQQIHDGRLPIRPDDLQLGLESSIRDAVEQELSYSLRPLINATGVILHTNLGRAPLGRDSLNHLIEVATQYSNLEYDLASGRRGERDVHVSRQLQDLLGVPGIAVNNNAAAVLITLNTLADGGEVIVYDEELI